MLDNSCKWKPCHIFSDYYMVSSDGKVYSVRNRKCISPAKDKSGYLYYVLCVGGERKTTGGYTVAKYQKCRQQEESGCFWNGKAAIAVSKYHFGEE